MVYSTNGTNWTPVTQSVFESSDQIRKIAYGNGKFVAGVVERYGDNIKFKMMHSSDGINNWTLVPSSPSFAEGINAIVYGDGKFVVHGDMHGDNGMSYSLDGISWSAIFSSPFSEISVLAYVGGKFFVGDGDNGQMAFGTFK